MNGIGIARRVRTVIAAPQSVARRRAYAMAPDPETRMTATPSVAAPAPALQPSATPAKPPQAILGEMINGYWASFAVHAAAALGIADRLRGGPRTVGELARETDADPDALYRLLRALASLGV